jgi:hypothetical protein
VDELISRGDRVHIHKELCQNSGCDHVPATSWVLHKTYKTTPEEIALCPPLWEAPENAECKVSAVTAERIAI